MVCRIWICQPGDRTLKLPFQSIFSILSAYHLTIEPNTAMARMTSRGLIHLPEEGDSTEQFLLLNKLAGEMALNIMKYQTWQRRDINHSITAITGNKRNILAWGRLPIHSI